MKIIALLAALLSVGSAQNVMTYAGYHCDLYEKAGCGYGADPKQFANRTSCTTEYQSWTVGRRLCAQYHVTAAMLDSATHCQHARGNAPCDMNNPPSGSNFCAGGVNVGYTTACGSFYGTTNYFANEAQCTNFYNGLSNDNQECWWAHLGVHINLTNGTNYTPDTGAHCTHAAGVAPCTAATTRTPEANAHCDLYSKVCFFNVTNGFKTMGQCQESFSAEPNITRKLCQQYHLTAALTTGMTNVHCPHASGVAPCSNTPTAPTKQNYCAAYDGLCGTYNKTGYAFTDNADCQVRYSDSRMTDVDRHCWWYHQAFHTALNVTNRLAADPGDHCKHASGAVQTVCKGYDPIVVTTTTAAPAPTDSASRIFASMAFIIAFIATL